MASVVFGLSQKGKRKLIDSEGHSYIQNSVSKNKKIEYWKCTNRICTGRFIYHPATGEGKISTAHIADEQPDPTWRARDAALERLRQLTISVDENVKAIDLVRKVLKELPAEARPLMPTECSLIERVKRWAKTAGTIDFIKHSREDYILPEGEEPLSGVTYNSITVTSNSSAAAVSHSQDAFPRLKRKEKRGRLFKPLKRVDEDGNEIGEASLEEFLSGNSDWQSGSNRKFEHRHQSTTAIDQESASAFMTGNDTAENENDFGDQYEDDFQNEGADFEQEEEQLELSPSPSKSPPKLSSVVTTSSNPFSQKLPKKPKNSVKSGERCFVCGDELIVSETLGTSQETFRKACCYLNVKSEGKWFPRSGNSQFYSFCESCTNEITRIHSLYKKVVEIQSLIFKKVENVEKRIADAEIVDNWMAEAPHSTALRFEGFRKQVLINYRNKLKLRREIRFGKKTGDKFTEVLPGSTAHMFASDPSKTDAFRKIASDDGPKISQSSSFAPRPQVSKRTRGRPKSKIPKEKSKPVHETSDSPSHNISAPTFDNDVEDFFPTFDDSQEDSMSVASERETKFWEDDPSKLELEVGQRNKRKVRNDNADDEDFDYGMGNIENDLSEMDESDEDWGSTTKKKRASNTKTFKQYKIKRNIVSERLRKAGINKINKNSTNKQGKSSAKPDSSKSKFPDAVLTKDGRVFMQGIEIIKNPPGAYKLRPYSISFSCGACGKMLPKFWNIRQHICGHHLGMYKCHICHKEYTDPKAVEKHIAMKHETPKYENCPICGKPVRMYDNQRNMNFHRWCHLSKEEKQDPKYKSWRPTKDKDPNDTTNKVEKQTFMCGQCGKNFLLPSVLRRHELRHGQDTETTKDSSMTMCQYCGKTFASRKGLTRHVRICTSNAQGRINLKSYPCPKCPTRCSTSQARGRHMRRFHRNKTSDLPFPCPKCSRGFTTRIGLRHHKRVCIDGEKGYHSKNVLERHASRSSANSDDNTEVKADPNASTSSMGGYGSSGLLFGSSNSQFDLNSTTGVLGFNYNFMGGSHHQQ